ncbi:MAG: hypothetical protein QM775_36305 [Pirellulales bacterium]
MFIPCLSYRDAKRTIDDLCQVLGCERHAVYEDGEGGVAHAELKLGSGLLMLGSKRDNEFGRMIKMPDEVGRCETQSPYVCVPDADAVYARAQAAGWEIVMPIKDEDYGGRGFCARDRESHLWYVGTYDPLATKPSS